MKDLGPISWEAVLDTLPVSLYIVDRDLRIVAWNRFREQGPLGVPREKALGRRLEEILSPEGREAAVPLIREVFATGVACDVTTVANLGGRVFHVRRLPISHGGAVTHVLSWFEDITERQLAQNRLRDSEELHRRLTEVSPDAIFIQDGGTLVYASAAAADLLGAKTPQDIIGRETLSFIHPNDRADVAERSRQLSEGVAAQRVEERLIGLDGRVVDAEVAAVPFTYQDRPAILVVARDVSARKHAEAVLREREAQHLQAQKMEAIGQLAGGVAHDFNNLLGVITGHGELLLKNLARDDPHRGRVEQIVKAGMRAAALTRQLLAFGRKQVLQPQVLDINGIVEDVGKMLQRLIGEDILLTLVTADSLGRVRADPTQIEQVIVNLAVNARDAMPDGGTLAIETGNAELDFAYASRHAGVQPGPHVMLAVTDTGHGMDAATQARMFEPFFTTKQPGRGTGLGLATVHGIVKQSGGHIWVYSELGRGTTFKVYLPSVDQAAEALPAVAREPPARGSETVLLVEDEESLRHMTREILEEQGYTVLDAPAGAAALHAADNHDGPIHLALTDVVMPGMSGPELVQILTQRRPETRVLYMSGYTDESLSHHGVLDAGTHLIEKPFTSDALLRKVREVLSGPPGPS